VQRSYPRIAARVREQDGVMARFPGGTALLLAPALVAVLVMPAAREEARLAEMEQLAQLAWDRAIQRRETPVVRPRPIRDTPVVPRQRDSILHPDSLSGTDSLPVTDTLPPADSVRSFDSTFVADTSTHVPRVS
jgi:hypothetical protein